MIVRLATLDDASIIARAHLDSHIGAYTGLLSSESLPKNTIERREMVRGKILRGEGEPGFTLVAEVNGQIVGFAGGGADRTDNPDYDGELFAIYLRPSDQRKGIGRILVSAIARRFLQDGVESLLVQALAENEGVEFYASLGAVHLYDRKVEVYGDSQKMSVYGWQDISSLIG